MAVIRIEITVLYLNDKYRFEWRKYDITVNIIYL